MTKFSILTLLFILSSCSSPSFFDRIEKEYPKESDQFTVENRLEAKKGILKEYNFLKLLFTESREPYYGTPRWGDKCLKDNYFEYKEEGPMIALKTILFVEREGWKPGFCEPKMDVYKLHALYLYCGNNKYYLRVILPLDKEYKLDPEVLCP